MRVRILILLGVAACGYSTRPGDLPDPGSPIAPSRECQTIGQILARARPEPNAARVLKRVHACPSQAGDAIARTLDSLRLSRDTTALLYVADLTQYVHDARVFDAVFHIAGDTAASIEARVVAFRSLVWSIAPGHMLSFRSMQLQPQEAKCGRSAGQGRLVTCSSSYTSHFYSGYGDDGLRWPAFGIPLPAGYIEQIRGLCSGVGDNQEEPDLVRRAASHTCWWDPDAQLLDLIGRR